MTILLKLKLILNLCENIKNQHNFEKWREESLGLTLPDFKTFYIGTVINTVEHWKKDRHTNPYSRIESSDTVRERRGGGGGEKGEERERKGLIF